MKNIYDRIFKNWKTSIFGLVIIAIGFLFVWFGKASMTELTAFISGALVLLFSKDDINKGVLPIALLGALTLSSCSADWHFQQACKKEPMFCEAETIVEFDTFVIRDTQTFIKEYHTKQIDTIVMDTNGVKVVVYRVRDSIRLVLTQKPDTVRITANKVVKSKPVVIKQQSSKTQLILLVLAGVVLGWILRSFR